MEQRSAKPSSIWLTQFLLLSMILFVGIFYFPAILLDLAPRCSTTGLQTCLIGKVILDLTSTVFLLAVLLLAVWGLQRRKRYGKWLGVAVLLFFMVGFMGQSPYFQMIYRLTAAGIPLPTPPYECALNRVMISKRNYCGYSSYPDLVLRATLDILFPAILLGFLAIRVAFGQAATRFFSPSERAR
jgi:hypothetical protein